MPARRLIRVLSIDGGGIRGVIPALILQRLELLAKRPLYSLFDLIAGTSTGGILAVALTTPDPRSATPYPLYSAGDALGVYTTRGSQIFSNVDPTKKGLGLDQKFKDLKLLSGPKYDGRNLERVLTEHFGTAMLRDSLCPLLITAYDIERRRPFLFKTRLARTGRVDHNFELRQVARSTSAAPLYFPPNRIQLPQLPGQPDAVYSLVDGGIIANNPAMLAYLEAKEQYPNCDILLVSLGTGQLNSPLPYKEAKDWGIVGWARPLIDCLFTGASDLVDSSLQQTIGAEPGSRYYRFQVDLEGAPGAEEMDNTTPQNIQKMRELVEMQIFARRSQELAAIAAALLKDR